MLQMVLDELSEAKDPIYLATERVKLSLKSFKELGPAGRGLSMSIGSVSFPIKGTKSKIYINVNYDGKPGLKKFQYRLWKQDGSTQVGKASEVKTLQDVSKVVDKLI